MGDCDGPTRPATPNPRLPVNLKVADPHRYLLDYPLPASTREDDSGERTGPEVEEDDKLKGAVGFDQKSEDKVGLL